MAVPTSRLSRSASQNSPSPTASFRAMDAAALRCGWNGSPYSGKTTRQSASTASASAKVTGRIRTTSAVDVAGMALETAAARSIEIYQCPRRARKHTAGARCSRSAAGAAATAGRRGAGARAFPEATVAGVLGLLVLESARKGGHGPLGTFDRDLADHFACGPSVT